MKINDVMTTGSLLQQESLSKKEKPAPPLKTEKKDNVDISFQAKKMADSQELSPKERAKITHRLATGFYDQESVLNKVADEILQSEEFKKITE